MRNAYGLASKTSFTSITGESTESFPSSPLLTPGNEVNDPNCLDVIALFDIKGNPTTVEADNATRAVRRCTVAAKLKAIYGSVSNLDAFTGMMAEKHVAGSELGELQLATWKDQFGAARDADRFFYLNDPLQSFIRNNFGIDSRKTLAQVIAANTDVPVASLPANVFRIPGSPNTGTGVAATDATAPEAAPARTDSFSAAGTAVLGDSVATPTASNLTRRNSKSPSPSQLGNQQSAVTAGYPAARRLARKRKRCIAATE
jgi:heme peroxidase